MPSLAETHARVDGSLWKQGLTGCWESDLAVAGRGYPYLRVGERSVGRSKGVHVIQYERYHGPVPTGMLVRHSCDNMLCGNPRHLLLGTYRDNTHDMLDRGRHKPRRGLTPSQVTEIRSALADGEVQRSIARRYGVTPSVICTIAKGRTYKEVV